MTNRFAQLAGKTCLVTGGAGFIGSHLASHLVRLDCRVRVIDNLSTGFETNLAHLSDKIEFIRGDVNNPELLEPALADVDTVFHHAAMASVPRSMRDPGLCHHWTATSTLNILQTAVNQKVRRMVLASTSAAYGNSAFVAKRESDSLMPLSPYAAAKIASEMYCQAFYRGLGLETVCLRYFNVFGPRQDPQSEYSAVIPRFVAKILEHQQPVIFGDGLQSRDFVFVDDVVQANLLAATVPTAAGKTFNVARGTSVTLLELLDTLSNLLGHKITPLFDAPREGDVRDSMADISMARKHLNFDPQTTVRDGLRKSIDYYQTLCSSPQAI